jgi:hypothetical protein
VTLDGVIVDCEETGVPVSSVDVVVVLASVVVVGVAWPVVATVVVPVGWLSAKAAGAERKSAMLTAETASPVPPARVAQLSEEGVPAPSMRIRSTRSNGSDHDSAASSHPRMSTVARRVRSSRSRALDHDPATRGVETLTMASRVRSSRRCALDHDGV